MAGVWRWPPTPSSAEMKERVEYTSVPFLGLHGLYGDILLKNSVSSSEYTGAHDFMIWAQLIVNICTEAGVE